MNQTTSVSSHGMPLSEVPAALQRRALRRMEELRSDGWEAARLAPSAVALLRPDIDDVAYYEFSVLDANGQSRGYIIASTGEHDSPLPLVSQSGRSPSTRLRNMSATEPSRYYMIDVFTFVAEGKTGELLAKIGNLPSQPATQSGQRRVEGGLRGTDWASWSDLKRDYADAYAEPLEGNAEQVLKAWDTENDLTDYGEALFMGAERWLPALENDVEEVAVVGEGAPLVRVKQTERGVDLGFAIEMVGEPAETASVALQVAYGSGRQETLNFGLVSNAFLAANGLEHPKTDHNTRQNPRPCGGGAISSCIPHVTTSRRAYYPEVDASDGTLAQQLAVAQSQQAWYAQLEAGDDYNPYDCASGCAGTAWAMLMAWVDNRAEDRTSQFAGDWGIYRKSLSETGLNQVAPLNWSADGAKRLVGAVAGELDGGRTFCLYNDARATAPSAMSKVKGWLQRRSDLNLHVAWENDFASHSKYIELAETEVIDNHRPAVIGFGKLLSSHYAVLYGVEFIHQIVVSSQVSRNTETVNWRVNMGWGGGEKGDVWMDRNAWFVGRISPKDHPEEDTGHALPAVCTNNAERNQACPAGQTGTKRQRCIDGQWRTDSNTCKRVDVGSGTGGSGHKEP
jgi:hypothetical protein